MGDDILPGKWWHMPRVAKKLELSKEEKKELDDLFVKSRRRLIDLKSTIEKERFELENLLESETLDETATMEQFKKLEKAREDLSTERFSFLLKVRKYLGFGRYQYLKTFFGEHQMRKRHEQGMRQKP
jgi:Spy/CpxP family protein refolding chaperone